ncbi:type II toxin-antitoxin system VapC family toxin [Mycobacterium shinjukuense]|uniref:Ribonuclease VapC n=1 Tax=Mycobacterium shinjukuense TaxID=398694 RepID=A0A7I7MKP6_9MYCO|nr:type II toxin-antitoxin system VapC family toxin [Mycobacterium shinjukuense]MCV6985153.1 type II toxin-antitoxin system VapC family toxin [Mycobacterium shinjukuense]ORB63796.1 VapC toxin family PIN domain ribonuclease [Mycobacterium shinjukuense]BBX72410.1 ribonuclease VapC32 [Mycobacterium shinjukuense]
MILVDTAIWIDHLRAGESRLVDLLSDDDAGCHPLVIEEMALGSIRQRDVVLDLLANLYQFPTVTHPEVLHLIDRRRLWGRGLSAVDLHLLGSVALVVGAGLWTRDKRLKAACADVGVPLFDEGKYRQRG